LAMTNTRFRLYCRAFDWRSLVLLQNLLALNGGHEQKIARHRRMILRSPQNDKTSRRSFLVREWCLTRATRTAQILLYVASLSRLAIHCGFGATVHVTVFFRSVF